MISLEEAEIRSNIIKSMAHPIRLIIVDLLQDGEKPFSQIKKKFQFDKSTISKHLSLLKEAGIVSSKKIGTETIYKLEVPCVADFFNCATVVIENNVNNQLKCLCK